MERYDKSILKIIKLVLSNLFILCLIIFLIDKVCSKCISSIYDLDFLFIMIVIIGTFIAFNNKKYLNTKKRPQNHKFSAFSISYLFALSAIGIIIVFINNPESGCLKYFLSIFGGLSILGLNYLALHEKNV